MNTSEQDLEEGTTSGAGASGRFLHVAPKTHPFRGKLIERVTEATPNAVKRTFTTKKGEERTVWELPYSSVTGKIIGLYNKERQVDYGDGPKTVRSSVLVLSVKGERLNIELEEQSRFWPAMCMALPNVDLGRMVRASAWDYDHKTSGDRKVGFSLSQKAIDGKTPAGARIEDDGTYSVPWYWNKDNPGKLPPAEEFKHPKTGEVEWFFDKRDEYLRETIIPAIAERIAKVHESDLQEAEATAAPTALDAAAQHAQAKLKPREDAPPVAGYPAGPKYEKPTEDPFPVQRPITGDNNESDLDF